MEWIPALFTEQWQSYRLRDRFYTSTSVFYHLHNRTQMNFPHNIARGQAFWLQKRSSISSSLSKWAHFWDYSRRGFHVESSRSFFSKHQQKVDRIETWLAKTQVGAIKIECPWWLWNDTESASVFLRYSTSFFFFFFREALFTARGFYEEIRPALWHDEVSSVYQWSRGPR